MALGGTAGYDGLSHLPGPSSPPSSARAFNSDLADQRSHRPAGQIARLQFRASGPTFVLLEVPAGAQKAGTLLANEVGSVAFNGVPQNVPVKNQLDVVPTKEFPTPVT
jgi:hypothetical protein